MPQGKSGENEQIFLPPITGSFHRAFLPLYCRLLDSRNTLTIKIYPDQIGPY